MSTWELYLLSRLNSVHTLSIILLVASGIGAFILIAVTTSITPPYDESEKQVIRFCGKIARWVAGIGCIAALSVVLVPTNADLAVIIAAKWATNSEEMRKLPDNATRTLNHFLEQYAPEKSEQKKEK